ncbi:hypothetical protein [Sphingomonas montanisoli]|uniref:Uncharacterized protein n=1 Tax=Sphingomonas montanisoli TaxID=2606412 RepID=A0A5D9C2V7_9SPHN|nr:hypothetical protein [Sphingomonas montanisoli]TZG25602.1 hypothetical protein FYJ91_11290 [Sphingomonas montanisoli]
MAAPFNEERFFAAIDEGLPFEGFTGWLPSELFTIGAGLLSTSRRGHAEGQSFKDEMVAAARDLHRGGYFANPFAREHIKRTDLVAYREMMARPSGRKGRATA